MSDLHDGLEHLPLGDAPQLDHVCDAFEAAWRAGGHPRVEDYAPPGAGVLLCELVCVDAEYRRAAGERPTVADYLARFPTLDSAWLAELLSAPVPESAEPRAAGKRLGRFDLLAEVGRGACGTVWRAHDPLLNRVVALKVPHPGLVGSPEAVERFRREGQTAAALRHPGIVAVHDVAMIDGNPVLVQDFLDGESLRARLAGGRIAPREAAAVAAQVADALDYAHRAGAVHRDIKPANIVLTRDGRAVLVDFGLALQDGGTLTLTADGQVVGTPAYMSPEQAAGHAHAVDPRSDVYSLGVVLYEMLAGGPPFRETQAAQLLRRVIEDDPDPPRRHAPDVPRDLETVCLRAMAKEPHRRYPTAAALADDLRRFLAGEPVAACPAGRVERAVRWVRRHPGPTALAAISAVAVAALVGAAVAWSYNARLDRANRELEQARANEAAQHRETETAYYFQRLALASREWVTGNTGRVRQLLDECPPELRGWEWRYLDGLTRRELLTLAHSNDADPSRQLMGLAYSPDGSQLATAGFDGRVRVWDESGRKVSEFRCCEWGVMAVAWHPDGRRLAAVEVLGRVGVWSATTGRMEREFRLPQPASAYRVCFRPDGRHLAVGGGDGPWEISDRSRRPGTVRVWDIETGDEILKLDGFGQAVMGVAYSPDGTRLATAEGAQHTAGALGRPGAVAVWNAASGERLWAGRGHEGPLTGIAYSPDGTRLATSGWDRSVVLWDAATGTPGHTLVNHRDWVRGVAFAPDGLTLASAGADGTVVIWNAATGRFVRRLRGHTQAVSGVAFHPAGDRLASASADKTVKVWNPWADTGARVLAGAGPITALAFAPDGCTLFTAGYAKDGPGDPRPAVTAWDPDTGVARGHAFGHTDRILGVAVSADGRRVASGGRDRTVRLWTASLAAEQTLSDHYAAVSGVAFRPDGRQLAATNMRIAQPGVYVDELRLWEIPPAKPEGVADGRDVGRWSAGIGGSLQGVAYSADGSLAAVATNGGFVCLWNTATGQEAGRVGGHTRMVSGVAFSRDGELLASCGADYAARVWRTADVRRGATAPIATFSGHTRGVTAVAFSPDATRIATGSEDGTVKAWDVRTGQEALTLAGHTGTVTAVAFSPDGRILASSSNDGTVRLWEADR